MYLTIDVYRSVFIMKSAWGGGVVQKSRGKERKVQQELKKKKKRLMSHFPHQLIYGCSDLFHEDINIGTKLGPTSILSRAGCNGSFPSPIAGIVSLLWRLTMTGDSG
jgi:hypothetical protein